MAIKRRSTRKDLLNGILNGDRIRLSQAITVVESQRPEDQQMAAELLDSLITHTGGSIRIGVTGVPGAGKSTFIEAFGLYLTSLGKQIAVLSIDPTSALSRGSILGDKSRMPLLAQSPNAYIRPSPTGQSLGGVAQATNEIILLCEAAKFDVVIVETVGVGQSETMVKDMVDFFLLLMLSGGGDELQGIKRGIMEMADALVINKADGQNIEAAKDAAQNYKMALHLFPPRENQWQVPVATCSAMENTGITNVWEMIGQFVELTRENGSFEKNRETQRSKWFDDAVRTFLVNQILQNSSKYDSLDHLQREVISRHISVRGAISRLPMT